MEALTEQAVLDRLLVKASGPCHAGIDDADCLAWMKQLIKTGANVNAVVTGCHSMERFACTAIHTATYWNSIDKMKVLVDSGAQINLPNEYGETPLLIAACTESYDTRAVRWLMKRGARWQLAFVRSPLWDIYEQETHRRVVAATIVEKLCGMVVELNES